MTRSQVLRNTFGASLLAFMLMLGHLQLQAEVQQMMLSVPDAGFPEGFSAESGIASSDAYAAPGTAASPMALPAPVPVFEDVPAVEGAPLESVIEMVPEDVVPTRHPFQDEMTFSEAELIKKAAQATSEEQSSPLAPIAAGGGAAAAAGGGVWYALRRLRPRATLAQVATETPPPAPESPSPSRLQDALRQIQQSARSQSGSSERGESSGGTGAGTPPAAAAS